MLFICIYLCSPFLHHHHACCDGLRLLVGNKQPITYNVSALAHGYLVFVNTTFTHFIFQIKNFQSQFVGLDHPMLYCTHLTCPISHNAPHSPQMVYINHETKWTIPLFAKENIDYNYKIMNNILIGEILGSLLLWCTTWFKYVNIAKTCPSITWSDFNCIWSIKCNTFVYSHKISDVFLFFIQYVGIIILFYFII